MSIPIRVEKVSPAAPGYRAARVRSMFNAPEGAEESFTFSTDLPVDRDGDWQIGVVAGPSGSGKSSVGEVLFSGVGLYEPEWPPGVPLVEAIAPGAPVDTVTGSLSQAGLGDVPTWLKPYSALSTGQKFRAGVARLLAERPEEAVVDEFTSVVDRQIARVGSSAFAKAWRRGPGKVVLLTCHYDVIDWVRPDWVLDMADGSFETKEQVQLRPVPRIDMEVRVGGWDLWEFFKTHHYLSSGPMSHSRCYVGFVAGEPVAHLGVSTMNVRAGGVMALEARACRLVVMPEWQGAGVGTALLNEVCRMNLAGEGEGAMRGRRMTTVFHTSHPQLCAVLRRSRGWKQVSAYISGRRRSASGPKLGGHTRAIQGFRYYGVGE